MCMHGIESSSLSPTVKFSETEIHSIRVGTPAEIFSLRCGSECSSRCFPHHVPLSYPDFVNSNPVSKRLLEFSHRVYTHTIALQRVFKLNGQSYYWSI